MNRISVLITALIATVTTARRQSSSNSCSSRQFTLSAYRSTPLGITPSAARRRGLLSDEQPPLLRPYNDITNGDNDISEVQLISSSRVAKNLLRGAFLRIASDISGGTPLESVKTRVTVTKYSMMEAYRSIVDDGGIGALWSGTPSRTVEGALLGALFLVGASATKKQVIAMGGGPTLAALCGGIIGGLAQAIVMTPAGMVFTSLNVNKKTPGLENDNAYTVTKRIISEKGLRGMFIGGGPMCLRQASNWASRSCFTEIARTQLKMSRYGLWGEIGSGVIGGLGSCWNTPVETVRVVMQKDVAEGKTQKSFMEYIHDIQERDGIPGLFRGVTPRGIQAIWQTVFMVVVPNILGV